MLFLFFSNVDIQFIKKEFIQKFCIAAKALSTIKWIEFIDKKKFTKVLLDENIKTFVVYVSFFDLSSILIYLVKKTQITLLVIEKITISNKFSNFTNNFLK